MKEKCSPSLLLPAITIKWSEEITGTVHIKNNNETDQVPVNVYVERLVDERDTAVITICLLRNNVQYQLTLSFVIKMKQVFAW